MAAAYAPVDGAKPAEVLAALPDVRILVGRWGPAALTDESTQLLRDAGASLVASTLGETRTHLGGLLDIPRMPAPELSAAH